MNPKLAAMGMIISCAGSDRGFSAGQTQMFAQILEPYSVEQIESAVEEHLTKFSGWPMSDDGLKAFKAMLKKAAGPKSTTAKSIVRTWSESGEWSGDWSRVDHLSLIWHFAQLAKWPMRCHLDKVAEFRGLCIGRRIPPDVLDGAVAAARVGDYQLRNFMAKVKDKAAA